MFQPQERVCAFLRQAVKTYEAQCRDAVPRIEVADCALAVWQIIREQEAPVFLQSLVRGNPEYLALLRSERRRLRALEQNLRRG
jgi:hypothetical protein